MSSIRSMMHGFLHAANQLLPSQEKKNLPPGVFSTKDIPHAPTSIHAWCIESENDLCFLL